MKHEDVEDMLNRMPLPEPERLVAHPELKIPLLSYRKSSRAGLWLLLVPLVVAITALLKLSLHLSSSPLQVVRTFFAGIDSHPVLTYLIPIVFIGFPLATLILNLLAFCHFQRNRSARELVITIKFRPLNLLLFFLSLALLVFFLLPDNLSFH